MIGRKTIVWIFHAANILNLTSEDVDMAKKEKP